VKLARGSDTFDWRALSAPPVAEQYFGPSARIAVAARTAVAAARDEQRPRPEACVIRVIAAWLEIIALSSKHAAAKIADAEFSYRSCWIRRKLLENLTRQLTRLAHHPIRTMQPDPDAGSARFIER